MKTNKILWTITLLGIVAIMVIQLKKNKEITLNKVYQYDNSTPISIQVDTLRREFLSNTQSYTGTFEPDKETKITADLPGKIVSMLVDVGSKVKKGQPLIQLDKSTLELELKQAEINIKGLKEDVKRYSVLVKADAVQGIKLEKAQLGLESAIAQKSILIDKIKKTTITAPYDGIITIKFKEKGEFAAPGIPLLQLVDISTLKFTITVPENELNLFNENNIYSVSPNIYPENKLPGKLILIGDEANKMSHSFPVQFSVKNTPALKVKAGMFGTVKTKNENNEKQIIISASYVVGSSIHPQVYIVEDGKAILRNILISRRFQNEAVVSEGLNDGDIIVTNGYINLFNGANVTVKN